jgi:hypothetical protein
MPLLPGGQCRHKDYFCKKSDKIRTETIWRRVMMNGKERIIALDDIPIDLSDIPEITDFSTAHKNPYYEKIRKNGFTIIERYSPEDVTEIINGVCSRDANSLGLDPEEQKAFEKYIETNKKYIKGQ